MAEGTLQQMNGSQQSLNLPVGPVEGIDDDGGVALNMIEHGDVEADTATSVFGEKKTTRSTPFSTRKRLFIASLVIMVALMGTLIGVSLSRAGDDGGGGGGGGETPDSGSRTDSRAQLQVEAPPTTSDCSDCKEEGYFCSLPEGSCVDGGEGNCIPKPEICTADYTPVCGCDGVTYGNACSAAAAGVSIDFQGECMSVEPSTTSDCCDSEQEGYFCSLPEGSCADGGEGKCILKPVICTREYTPMCGCDGITYSNACSAAAKGVSVKFEGKCDTLSQGRSDCEGADDVWVFPEGDCGVLLAGECTPKPDFCNRMEAPVCGCDGISYLNACIAISEGASIFAQGECVP